MYGTPFLVIVQYSKRRIHSRAAIIYDQISPSCESTACSNTISHKTSPVEFFYGSRRTLHYSPTVRPNQSVIGQKNQNIFFYPSDPGEMTSSVNVPGRGWTSNFVSLRTQKINDDGLHSHKQRHIRRTYVSHLQIALVCGLGFAIKETARQPGVRVLDKYQITPQLSIS